MLHHLGIYITTLIILLMFSVPVLNLKGDCSKDPDNCGLKDSEWVFIKDNSLTFHYSRGWNIDLKFNPAFKITEQSLENLKSEDVPDDILEKLQNLKDQEFTEEEFLDILKITIGDEQTVRFKSLILKYTFIPCEKLNENPKTSLENPKEEKARVTLTFPVRGGKTLTITFRYLVEGLPYSIDIAGATYITQDEEIELLCPIYICCHDKPITKLYWSYKTSMPKDIKCIPCIEGKIDTPGIHAVKVNYWDDSEEPCKTVDSKVTTFEEILRGETEIPRQTLSIEDERVTIGGGVTIDDDRLKFTYIIDKDVDINFTSRNFKIGDEVYGDMTFKDWNPEEDPEFVGRVNLTFPLRGQKTLAINLKVLPSAKRFFIKVTVDGEKIVSDYKDSSSITIAPRYICAYDIKKITHIIEWLSIEEKKGVKRLDYPMFISPCYGDGAQVLHVAEGKFLIFKKRFCKKYPCKDKDCCKVIFTTWERIIEGTEPKVCK